MIKLNLQENGFLFFNFFSLLPEKAPGINLNEKICDLHEIFGNIYQRLY